MQAVKSKTCKFIAVIAFVNKKIQKHPPPSELNILWSNPAPTSVVSFFRFVVTVVNPNLQGLSGSGGSGCGAWWWRGS